MEKIILETTIAKCWAQIVSKKNAFADMPSMQYFYSIYYQHHEQTTINWLTCGHLRACYVLFGTYFFSLVL